MRNISRNKVPDDIRLFMRALPDGTCSREKINSFHFTVSLKQINYTIKILIQNKSWKFEFNKKNRLKISELAVSI